MIRFLFGEGENKMAYWIKTFPELTSGRPFVSGGIVTPDGNFNFHVTDSNGSSSGLTTSALTVDASGALVKHVKINQTDTSQSYDKLAIHSDGTTYTQYGENGFVVTNAGSVLGRYTVNASRFKTLNVDNSKNLYGVTAPLNISGSQGIGFAKVDSTYASTANTGWFISGATLNCRASFLASDGSIYAVGNSNTPNTIFVMKINSSGVLQWARQYGTLGLGSVNITELSGGDLVVSWGGTGSNKGMFRFTSGGTLVWGVTNSLFGGNTITVDSSGNLYTSASTVSGVYVGKFNSSNGALIWARYITTGQSASINNDDGALAVTSDSVYVAGSMSTTARTTSGTVLMSLPFVAKLPLDGGAAATFTNFSYQVVAPTISTNSNTFTALTMTAATPTAFTVSALTTISVSVAEYKEL